MAPGISGYGTRNAFFHFKLLRSENHHIHGMLHIVKRPVHLNHHLPSFAVKIRDDQQIDVALLIRGPSGLGSNSMIFDNWKRELSLSRIW